MRKTYILVLIGCGCHVWTMALQPNKAETRRCYRHRGDKGVGCVLSTMPGWTL